MILKDLLALHKNDAPTQIAEGRGWPMHELVDKWIDQNKAHSWEGQRGVRNLVKLAGALNSDYRDIDDFLIDNPGAIEALVEWIQESRVAEWKESLEGEVGGGDDEDEDDEDK